MGGEELVRLSLLSDPSFRIQQHSWHSRQGLGISVARHPFLGSSLAPWVILGWSCRACPQRGPSPHALPLWGLLWSPAWVPRAESPCFSQVC